MKERKKRKKEINRKKKERKKERKKEGKLKLYKAMVIIILVYGCETGIKKSGIVKKENEIIFKKCQRLGQISWN